MMALLCLGLAASAFTFALLTWASPGWTAAVLAAYPQPIHAGVAGIAFVSGLFLLAPRSNSWGAALLALLICGSLGLDALNQTVSARLWLALLLAPLACIVYARWPGKSELARLRSATDAFAAKEIAALGHRAAVAAPHIRTVRRERTRESVAR